MFDSVKIKGLKPREKRYVVTVEKGLSLRVHPSGVKSWVVRISQAGRVIDITLGRWPDISLAQAKSLARKKQKAHSVEPVAAYVLKDAFALWCNLKRGRIVSYADERRRLERYIIKPLGNVQLDSVNAPLIIKTVSHLDKSNKRATLKRVLMRTREILDLAVCAGYIDHNPINRVSRVFAPVKVKSMPAMDWRELPMIMRVVAKAPVRIQNFFLFSLCTMLRPGENAKLEKAWIDADTITIPASEMKKGRAHRVPLTFLMRKLIEREKELSPHPRNRYVFAGRDPGSHISKQAIAKWLHGSELRGRLVAHGLRTIARCWLADNDVQFEIAEACLSHQVGDSVYKAYQRSDFLDARRVIMERWCSYILICATSAGILTEIPMPAGYSALLDQ